jgi:Glycosyltransferases involved in cell wall biogenesis
MLFKNTDYRKSLSVILPVHNQELQIRKNLDKMLGYLERIGAETIIVENGSTDSSIEKINAARQTHRFIFIKTRVPGRGHALKMGVAAAHGGIIGYMDTDLAVSLRYIPKVLREMSDYDIVIGNRYKKGAIPRRSAGRYIESKLYIWLIRCAYGSKVGDFQCGFKFFRADFLKSNMHRIKDDKWFFDTKIVLLAEKEGRRIFELPVNFTERKKSTVKISDPLYFIKSVISDKLFSERYKN